MTYDEVSFGKQAGQRPNKIGSIDLRDFSLKADWKVARARLAQLRGGSACRAITLWRRHRCLRHSV